MPDDPWPGRRCSLHRVQIDSLIAEFETVLADAHDERPVQTFLAVHPELMVSLLPPGGDTWCFDRPRLGGDFIPDFLLCTRNSTGYQWILIEIESPTKPLLTGKGLPSGKLTEAMGQIRDWRSWIRSNVGFAQSHLTFTGLTAEAKGFVVMGRRAGINQRHFSRYRELTDERIAVMTYDRLIDSMARGRALAGAST
jgi:hypothetical protein